MKLFNVFIVSVFFSVICLTACKRDLVGPVDNQTKLSQKEIEIKWAEARSGRWFNYSHYHALKQSEKETIDTLRYMDALYSYTKNAQLYYKKMLISNYDNIVNIDSYLDSIYPIIYREMDEKMANPKYMEELFSEYTNIEVMPVPKDKSIFKLSMLIDPVTVTRCEIPQFARDFSYHLEHFEEGGGSAFFGADLCVFEAQEDLRRIKDMIYGNSTSCAGIEMQLQLCYYNFKRCIETQLGYMNIGGDYWDITPPTATDGGYGQNGDIKYTSLNAAQKAVFLKMLDEANKNCVYKKLINYFKNSGELNITLSSGGNSAVYKPSAKEMIYSGELFLGYTELFSHEAFHAYQHQSTYGSSFSNYSRGQTGNINIEFEQIVFQDISRRVKEGTTGIGNMFKQNDKEGFSDAKTAYTNWINQITNNGTIYPNLAGNTNFVNDYKQHLGAFKEYGHIDYSSTNIVPSLGPEALKKIFSGDIGTDCSN